MTQIISKPNLGDQIVEKDGKALQVLQGFLDEIVINFNELEEQINPVVKLNLFTVATVPDPTVNRGGQIYVTDETGGEVPAFSDGTNWLRVTDRAIIMV